MITHHSSLAAMLFAACTIHTQAVGCYPAWKSGGSYTDGSIASNAVATTDNSSVTTASSNYACVSNTNWALCGQPGYERGTAGGDIVWTSTGTCEDLPSYLLDELCAKNDEELDTPGVATNLPDVSVGGSAPPATGDPLISPVHSKNKVNFDWLASWYHVLPVDDLDREKPIPLELLGMKLIAPRAPLSEGRVEEDGSILCSCHGRRYNGKGDPTAVPCAGSTSELQRMIDNPKPSCNAFPTKMKAALFYVWPASGSHTQIESEDMPLPDVYDDNELGVDKVRKTPMSRDYFYENTMYPAHLEQAHNGITASRHNAPTPFDVAITKSITNDGFELTCHDMAFKTASNIDTVHPLEYNVAVIGDCYCPGNLFSNLADPRSMCYEHTLDDDKLDISRPVKLQFYAPPKLEKSDDIFFIFMECVSDYLAAEWLGYSSRRLSPEGIAQVGLESIVEEVELCNNNSKLDSSDENSPRSLGELEVSVVDVQEHLSDSWSYFLCLLFLALATLSFFGQSHYDALKGGYENIKDGGDAKEKSFKPWNDGGPAIRSGKSSHLQWSELATSLWRRHSLIVHGGIGNSSKRLPSSSTTTTGWLGMLLLLLDLFTAAQADAAKYFPSLTVEEKEEYIKWVNLHSSLYHRSDFMASNGDSKDGAAVFWNIDGDTIDFAVAVRADGWVGFGISDAGGMIGSDIALMTASNPTLIVDAHVSEERVHPFTDNCQDWKLQNSPTVENGWMIMEIGRQLDTRDSQDVAIRNDGMLWDPSTRIIAAWGDSDFVSYHGGKKARKSIRLFADHSNGLTDTQVMLNMMEEWSDGYVDFVEDKYTIPAVDTTYHVLCRTFDDMIIGLAEDEELALIGFLPIITEETREFLHHFSVFVAPDCRSNQRIQSMVYTWAPGTEGWVLPEDVGLSLDKDSRAVVMEIHYDNPSFKARKIDSSGVRLYYTHEEREHKAGFLLLGDPLLVLDEKIGEGYTKYDFTCPGKCSSLFLGQAERESESQGVTVLTEFLHMHQTGVHMTNEVVRDGMVVHKATIEVYDFDQQGGYFVPQDTYKIMPGDSFRTSCYYKDGDSFGKSSQQEMCIAYIVYYPIKKIDDTRWVCPFQRSDFGDGCVQKLESSKLHSVEEVGRNFGISSGQCGSSQSATIESPTAHTSMVSANQLNNNTRIDTAQVAVLRAFYNYAADEGDLLQILEQRNISHCTILVPSDSAISRDLDDAGRLLNPIWKSHLQDLLLSTISEVSDLSDQLENSDTASVTLQTLQGGNVTLHRSDLEFDLNNSVVEKPMPLANLDVVTIFYTNRLSLPTSITHSLRDVFLQDSEDQFSTLFEFIQLANLEAPIAKKGPITFFAPTNAAWDALDPALLSSLKLPVYRKELLQVLSRHVVWDEIHISQEWMVGDTFHVLFGGEALTVTDVNPTVLNGTASIIMPDVLANNGVMHLVNSVILPVGFELKPRVAYMQTSNFGQHHPKANHRLNIVALGDSFIAGNGARGPNGERDYTNALCYKSDSSWPGLYATCVAEEHVGDINVHFANHACSGSYMADIYEKQLSGITSQTDLVFLSIGGNDSGFIEVAFPCYITKDFAGCTQKIKASKEIMERGELKERILQLLLDIRAAGHSGMKIILTGYSYLGNDVAFEVNSYPVGKEFYEAGDLLESIQEEVAEEANKIAGDNFVMFESVKDLFRGKEFSAVSEIINPKSWMIGFDPTGTFGFPGETYHYNQQGHAALGSHLCTRSTYGASQPMHDSTDEFSRSSLLIALFTLLVVSLVGLVSLTYIRASSHGQGRYEYSNRFSRRWSTTIHSVHLPLKNAMLTIAHLASTRPKACVAMGITVSLTLFACGLATNFNIVTKQDVLFMPKGSRSESEGAWVESMLNRWSNGTSDILDDRDIVLTIIVHKKGKNMVTTAGGAKMFDALDVVRRTPGYSDFCSIHGAESACPPGYEYICKLYSIPTEAAEYENKDCSIGGATGFWFHNRSMYDEQALSDVDVAEAMSMDVFFGDGQQLKLRDVLGNPVHEEGLLVSSTAFLSFVLFPKNVEGVENLRLSVVRALLDLQQEWKNDKEGEYELQFITSESFPDEILRSIDNDLVLFPMVFLVMSAFTCVAFATRDPVKSRSALGLGAVVTVLLSILTGYGVLFAIGVPLTSLTQILPFVILGVGLDDSFLIKNAYERSDPSKSVVDRIEDTIDTVGVSIAMTSFTSSLAFALGCFSSIPSVRWMCIYGVVTIMVDFFYQVTIFLALLVLDEDRINASRRDVLCCFIVSGHTSMGDEDTAVTRPGTIMNRYSKLLLLPATKVLVILVFSILFSICAIATSRLEIDFSITSMLPADSYVIGFRHDSDVYTQRRLSADIYFQGVDQSNITIQEQMKKYVNELVDGVDAIVAPPANFWVTDYQNYLDEQEDADLRGIAFNATLQNFLDDQRFDYKGSIILDEFGEIIASQTQISFDNLDIEDAAQVIDLMRRQQEVTSEQPINAGRDAVSSFFTSNSAYPVWDSLIKIEEELVFATIIGVMSMSVMALVFLPHWSGILFVLPMIISLYIDMMGVLRLAGVDINPVSSAAIVMSLGLYVDYVLHVLLCYYESVGPTRDEKVATMISTVGTSILLGGLSSFAGALLLAFTSSNIFYSVFVAFVSIVGLGLGHGLILLPTLLSLVGPENGQASDSLAEESAKVDKEVSHASSDGIGGNVNEKVNC